MSGYNEDNHGSAWPSTSYEGTTEKLLAAALPVMEAVQLRITAAFHVEKENFCQQLNHWIDNDRSA